jgi:hypothetical protein
MSYIDPESDISDVDVSQIVTAMSDLDTPDPRLDIWLADTDSELEAMAFGYGLDGESISTPINKIVKRYLVAYYCYIVFRDMMGASNTDDMAHEKYKQKFDIYANECNRLRQACTKDMIFSGDDDEAIDEIDRAPVNILVRG